MDLKLSVLPKLLKSRVEMFFPQKTFENTEIALPKFKTDRKLILLPSDIISRMEVAPSLLFD
jgi:hypothetical protein